MTKPRLQVCIKTINHLMQKSQLQVCKQQQTASGNKTNVEAYNLLVLAFLPLSLGALIHYIAIMPKP